MTNRRLLKATCLCGDVVILVEDDFIVAGYCHCSECQKFSGSQCSAWGRVLATKVRFEHGQGHIQHYNKNETGRVAFCRVCGSSLYNGQQDGEFINVRLGILDDAPSVSPSLHVYCASRAPWHRESESLPHFDTLPTTT